MHARLKDTQNDLEERANEMTKNLNLEQIKLFMLRERKRLRG